MSLNANGIGGGTQTTTQSPQSSVTSSGLAGTSTGTIQSGNSSSYLNSSNSSGLSLTPTSLSTVALNKTTATTLPASISTPVSKATHHFNTGLLIFALVLLVFAVGMTMQITKSAKITTE